MPRHDPAARTLLVVLLVAWAWPPGQALQAMAVLEGMARWLLGGRRNGHPLADKGGEGEPCLDLSAPVPEAALHHLCGLSLADAPEVIEDLAWGTLTQRFR